MLSIGHSTSNDSYQTMPEYKMAFTILRYYVTIYRDRARSNPFFVMARLFATTMIPGLYINYWLGKFFFFVPGTSETQFIILLQADGFQAFHSNIL